ncbi:hypothetical protein SAY86_006162 [Trapa natans]|uniref:F-box domain-containing protein n=1 Tax=Trapa natans TaxID=22666 RepID=A0AAN7L6T2_TRANT|nr:hypothetical protein SAY86_006162 [Trapa natans]
MNYFPDEVVENVFDYVTSHHDRNSISLVCKSWHRIERLSRQRVFIGNCYSISPEKVIERFPSLRSISLKGKPHFADFNLVPYDWGGHVYPWIVALAKSKVSLEALRLKRMVVSDESLELISRSFANFKSLVLVSCEGFTTNGLKSVAANCRLLRELDLQENEVEDHRIQWLNHFPESSTSLILDCIGDKGLEVVVSSCKDLQELRVFPSDPFGAGNTVVTEEGLVVISISCKKLMTNAALIMVAMNCPNFVRFRLCNADPTKADPVTQQPLDEGFGDRPVL